MNRKILFILLAGLFFLNFLSATDTEIKITTMSNHDLLLTFINPDAASTGGEIILETRRLNSGEEGIFSTTFSTSKDKFNLEYSLSKNGTKLIPDIIKDITSGETLNLLLIPGEVEVTKNYQEPTLKGTAEEIIIETSEIQIAESKNLSDNSTITGAVSDGVSGSNGEIDNPNNSKLKLFGWLKFLKISGFVPSEEEGSSSANFVYYGIGLVIVLAVIFFISRRMHRNSDFTNNSNKGFRSDEDELADAQRKIDMAQEEIHEVRAKRTGISGF